MTVKTTKSRAGPYPGDGVQTQFDFDFTTYEEEHLQVWLTEAGISTLQVLNTDYTVLLNPVTSQSTTNPGGTVVMVVPPTSAQLLTIVRVVPYTQDERFSNQGGWFPEVHERSFDLLTMMVQQIELERELSIRAPLTDPEGLNYILPDVAARAGLGISFDAQGNVIMSDFSGPEGPPGPAGTSITDQDTTAGPLNDKLVVAGSLAKEVLNAGGNEQLRITGPTVGVQEGEVPVLGPNGVLASAQVPNVAFAGALSLATKTIVVGGRYHTVDTEGGGPTDDLETIDGTALREGDLLYLGAVNASRVITVKDGVGNIVLADGDFVMDALRKRIVLQKVGAVFHEISRTDYGLKQTGLQVLEKRALAVPQATVEFVDIPIADYDYFQVDFYGLLAANDGVDLWVRMREQGGTWITGGSDYYYLYSRTTVASVAPVSANISYCEVMDFLGNQNSEHCQGLIKAYNMGSATESATLLSECGARASNNQPRQVDGHSYVVDRTTVCDGIQLVLSSGAINEGTFILSGFKT